MTDKNRISKAVIDSLLKKSKNKCAFPNCGYDLITSDGRLLGAICMIVSVRENSPRLSPNLSTEELYSEGNLICLCSNHHYLIDREPENYSVEFLKKIKNKHESSNLLDNSKNYNNIYIPNGLSLGEIIKFWNENYGNSSEEFWQEFFSNHPQIISFLYPNPIVKIGEKAYFGGKGLDNKGGNICDFVFKNKLANSIVIVEIKTPKTKLLGPLYRSNAYSLSTELTGAINQTLNYKTEIQRDFHRLLYESKSKFEVLEPTCFIICGNLNEEILDTMQMRSLNLFRNSLNNIIVVTYDELFEKVEMINKLKF